MGTHSVAQHLNLNVEDYDREIRRAGHGIDERAAYRHFDDWSKEERYFSLADELAALANAGFAQPECFWRRGPLAIYGGRASKPPK